MIREFGEEILDHFLIRIVIPAFAVVIIMVGVVMNIIGSNSKPHKILSKE